MIHPNISYQLETQFPALYREEGRELIELVKAYYEFMETIEDQSTFNARRLVEYRDIDSTLARMLVFFKNKYLSDLPLDTDELRFLVKKITDLYNRRGSEDGLQLFFKMFYEQDVTIYYPSVDILKPSESEWYEGKYIQLRPSIDLYKVHELHGKKIIGSISRAEGYVEHVSFIFINSAFTPVVFLDKAIAGSFTTADDILIEDDGVLTSVGRIAGSLVSIITDPFHPDSRSGYKIGDILGCSCMVGRGARVIVTEVTSNFTGEVIYSVVNPGSGYTEAGTRLLVSNQVLFLDNSDRMFQLRERLVDQHGTEAIVIGQNDNVVGVMLDTGDEFLDSSIIETMDRTPNITIPVTAVSVKNDSSPGPLYPDLLEAGADPSELDQAVRVVLANTETVQLISSDIIGDFLAVPLNSANFSATPPALQPMSGSDPSPNLSSVIMSAFAVEEREIGSIAGFINASPGLNYINQVFALADDASMGSFGHRDQILTLEQIIGQFSTGQTVTQGSVSGAIIRVDGNSLIVRPTAWSRFTAGTLEHLSGTYTIYGISVDTTSPIAGYNATILAETDFAVGKVKSVDIINSGFGYVDGSTINLRDENGLFAVPGLIRTGGTGLQEGKWKTYNSHLNIYDNKYIQDSNFYQDYSYEVSIGLEPSVYETTLKDVMHLSGTKAFGKFITQHQVKLDSSIQLEFISN